MKLKLDSLHESSVLSSASLTSCLATYKGNYSIIIELLFIAEDCIQWYC